MLIKRRRSGETWIARSAENRVQVSLVFKIDTDVALKGGNTRYIVFPDAFQSRICTVEDSFKILGMYDNETGKRRMCQ